MDLLLHGNRCRSEERDTAPRLVRRWVGGLPLCLWSQTQILHFLGRFLTSSIKQEEKDSTCNVPLYYCFSKSESYLALKEAGGSTAFHKPWRTFPGGNKIALAVSDSFWRCLCPPCTAQEARDSTANATLQIGHLNALWAPLPNPAVLNSVQVLHSLQQTGLRLVRTGWVYVERLQSLLLSNLLSWPCSCLFPWTELVSANQPT